MLAELVQRPRLRGCELLTIERTTSHPERPPFQGIETRSGDDLEPDEIRP